MMRRVIIIEADVAEGSTPLLDTFNQISQGQSKITIAQVKVGSTVWPLATGQQAASIV